MEGSLGWSGEPECELGFDPDLDPLLIEDGCDVPFFIWLSDCLSISLSSMLSPSGLLSVGVGPTFLITSISELAAEKMFESSRLLFCSIYISVKLDWWDYCSMLSCFSLEEGVVTFSLDYRIITSSSSSSSSSISEIFENDFFGRFMEISFLGLSD